MEQPEKEFIQEIKNLFEDYEEAYVPGEWESFSAAREKKYPFFAAWIKVAAVLFLIISVLPYRVNDLYFFKKAVEFTKIKHISDPLRTKPPLNNGSSLSKDNRIVANSTPQSLVPIDVSVLPIKKANRKQGEVIAAQLPQDTGFTKYQGKAQGWTGFQPISGKENVIAAVPLIPVQRITNDKLTLSNDSAILLKKDNLSTMEFLLAESRTTDKTKAKVSQSSKWGFGVEVAPNMTRTNMNLGGGLTTAYRLSNKFSLSSGISLLQLESGIDMPEIRQAKMSVSSLSSRELLAVDANIKAIDIPIAVVYHVNKHFYTSAGISYFNVISEKRNNTYVQTSQLSQTTTNPETGATSFGRVVINESVSEPVVETRLKGNSYLGFFNFSVGRRQSLFNKYNVLIEPFIKVPMGKLSAEDLKLTNSGLKFQISF